MRILATIPIFLLAASLAAAAEPPPQAPPLTPESEALDKLLESVRARLQKLLETHPASGERV